MANIYTKMKVFHYKEKVDSLSGDEKILAPIHIRIKPTNMCNHRCRYCAYRNDDMQLGKDMVIKDFIPKNKMLEIIDDISEMDVKAVTFSGGGEPLFYSYILDALKKLKDTKIKFAVLTNGALLNGEIAELFAMYASWVRISMDGWDDESYVKYRGVRLGEYTKIMNNIHDFKKLNGKCILGISIIVDRSNAGHLYEMVANLKKAGVDSIKISPCIVSNNGNENNKYHNSIFNTVKEQINKVKISYPDLSIFDDYHNQLETFKKNYKWCPYLQILPVIGADLNIYPCQDKAYNLKEGLIGTIKDKRFKDFWYNDKSKFFKINPSEVCNHHCVADGKNKLLLEYLDADKDHLMFV
ncbi:MAG: radical SAM protein [Actinobacteria bacterium]|nr:radical SAM protein [Actinomycetota bacterium]